MDGLDSHQGAPFVKPKKAKVKGSPGDDLIKIHRSASLENIFMYTVYIFIILLIIYIYIYICACVFVFNHIQLHRLLCLSAMNISWMHWNRTMSRHWKVTKSRTRSRCDARARLCHCRPCWVLMVLYKDIPPRYGLIWYSTSILGSWNSHWLFCYSEIQSSECLSLVLFRLNVTRVWPSSCAEAEATERRFSREQLRQKLRSP